MTYQPGIPTGSVPLNQDYLNIQGNFTQLNTQWQVDHVPLTSTSGSPPNGYHKAIHFVPQSAPSATPGYGELYTQSTNDGLSTGQQVFYQFVNGSSSTLNIPLTRNFLPVASATGYTFLPGGLIIQWGTKTSSGGTVTVTLPTKFPNNYFASWATMIRNSSNVDTIYALTSATAGSVTSIQFRDTSSGNPFFWWAIGN